MRLFNLMGSGSARAALYNACHVGSGMATSLKGRKPGRRARTIMAQMARPEPVLRRLRPGTAQCQLGGTARCQRATRTRATQFSGSRQARPDKPCSFFSNSPEDYDGGARSGVGWAFNVASRQIRLPGNSGSVKLHGPTLLRQPHPRFHRSGLQCPASSVEANR